jgi:hypothetical protein
MVVHPSVRVDKAGANAERELRRNDREVLGFMEDNSERLDKHGEVQEEEQSTAPLRKTGSERTPNKPLNTVRTVEVLETQRFISGAVSAPAAPAAPAPVPPPASASATVFALPLAPTTPAATAAAMMCKRASSHVHRAPLVESADASVTLGGMASAPAIDAFSNNVAPSSSDMMRVSTMTNAISRHNEPVSSIRETASRPRTETRSSDATLRTEYASSGASKPMRTVAAVHHSGGRDTTRPSQALDTTLRRVVPAPAPLPLHMSGKENRLTNADYYVESLFAVHDDDDGVNDGLPVRTLVPAAPAKPSFNDEAWLESQTQFIAAAAAQEQALRAPLAAGPPAPACAPLPPAASAPAHFNDEKWLDMDDDAFAL